MEETAEQKEMKAAEALAEAKALDWAEANAWVAASCAKNCVEM